MAESMRTIHLYYSTTLNQLRSNLVPRLLPPYTSNIRVVKVAWERDWLSTGHLLLRYLSRILDLRLYHCTWPLDV